MICGSVWGTWVTVGSPYKGFPLFTFPPETVYIKKYNKQIQKDYLLAVLISEFYLNNV